MRYRDPELRSALAAEYVLGTLHGAARRRFERLLARDPLLRGEVQVWESILAPLADALPGRSPPARVWRSIRERIDRSETGAPGRAWDSLRFWRWGGLAAATCALVLAVALGLQIARGPEIRYVAVITDGQQRIAWLVTAMPRSATLEVRTLEPQELAGDRSFELWLLPGGEAKPRSLGLLESDAERSRRLPRAVVESLPTGSGLAVSIEPRGGSPTGQPTGPVLYQGRLLTL